MNSLGKKPRAALLARVKGLATVAVMVLVLLADARNPLPAEAVTWQIGDVFAAVGSGDYQVYDNAGTFKETITQSLGGFTTGCAFNLAGDLYTTNFTNTRVFVFDGPHPHPVIQTIDTSLESPGGHSESIVFAANGDFYVGHPDGNDDIHRYNAAGVFQQKYNVAVEARGSDWIDLAVDQVTMFYSSEGRKIKRYNVGTDTQLADFATLPGSGVAYALRLLPPGTGSGGLLVADSFDVKRLDGTGTIVLMTYDVAGHDDWFALNLDPDGVHFWAGDFGTGKFHKFNILLGGAPVVTVDTMSPDHFGLCLLGEPTAAVPPSTPGKVSLGGYIDSEGNIVDGSVLQLQNSPVPDGKATFGGNVQFVSGDPAPTGNVRYIDHVTSDDIKATSFQTLAIRMGPCGPDTHALIIGKATVNGVPNQDLQIDVDDCSEPGSQQPSTSVSGPDMLMIKTGPDEMYMNGGPLIGGNIQVKKAQ